MAKSKRTRGPSARRVVATVADGLARSRDTKPAAIVRVSRATELDRPAGRPAGRPAERPAGSTQQGVARRRTQRISVAPTTKVPVVRASAERPAPAPAPPPRASKRKRPTVHATLPPVDQLTARFLAAIPSRIDGSEREQATALVAAIAAAPTDDAPLLVFADWLTEHGEQLGEYLHVVVALAGAPEDELEKLVRWERRLLRDHEAAIAGVFHDPAIRWRYERGVPVALGHAGVFRAPPPGEGDNGMYLQFQPTNTVFMCWEPADATAGRLVAGIEGGGKGTYRIAGLHPDGGVQLDFTVAFGEGKVDYNVLLRGATLAGDILSHINGWRHTTRWELVHRDTKPLDTRAKLPGKRVAVAATIKP